MGTQAGIGLQRQSINAEARRWTRQSQGSSESFLTVTPGYAAFLDVGQETLAVTCSPRRDGTVLDLEIKSGPESPFAAGPKKSLRTSIRLVPGQWQDLGGIIKSLKKQQNHVGTKGAGLKIRTLEASERVLVSVD